MARLFLGLSLCLTASACARTADKGDPGSPDNDASDRDDGTGEGQSSTTVDTWLGSGGCAFEEEPTAFTGGLAWLASLAPEGGAFSWTQEGARVAAVEGEIDWDEGWASTEATYIDGYANVRSAQELSFSLGANGAWTGSRALTITDRLGEELELEHEVRKEGCFTWETAVDEETQRITELESQLVSTTERQWTSVAGDEAGLTERFELSAVDEDDWSSHQSFRADDPGDELDPNRSGECVHLGDGTSSCDSTIHYEGGGAEWSVQDRGLEGDSTKQWERDRDGDGVIESWGTTFWAYEGDGWSSWITTSWGGEVTCSGSWAADGEGSWSCDNGMTGQYGS